mmetsp:Transcript_123837/g.361589  ORF Transcript_123837/g.361589 Transcript_123837/m.361589 type:complete len:229 (-) Transcript_123837:905-1591(-)
MEKPPRSRRAPALTVLSPGTSITASRGMEISFQAYFRKSASSHTMRMLSGSSTQNVNTSSKLKSGTFLSVRSGPFKRQDVALTRSHSSCHSFFSSCHSLSLDFGTSLKTLAPKLSASWKDLGSQCSPAVRCAMTLRWETARYQRAMKGPQSWVRGGPPLASRDRIWPPAAGSARCSSAPQGSMWLAPDSKMNRGVVQAKFGFKKSSSSGTGTSQGGCTKMTFACGLIR